MPLRLQSILRWYRTATYHRPTNRADTHATYRPNDRACTPTINRPTDRQALYLTTITTAAGTVLPPGQTAAMLAADSDLTVAALPAAYRYFTASACSTTTNSCCLPPAAKPTLCCLAALLPSYSATSIKKELPVLEYMDRNIWTEVTWSCI